MSVDVQERHPGFARLLARSAAGATLVDLVAEREPFVAAPVEVRTADGAFLVATRKEAGMSGPTLAWILGTLRVAAAGPVLGLDALEVDALTRFRDDLADRVVRLSTPE